MTSTLEKEPKSRRARGALAAWFGDIGWRTLLVLVAAILAGRSGPVPLTTAFSMLGVVVVTERVVRLRHRGMLDAALVGAGLVGVVLGLLGLLLNYLPWGLSTLTWSIGIALLELGALAWLGLITDVVPESPFRPLFGRSAIPTLAWTAAALVVLATALFISVRSFDQTHVSPLDLSAGPVHDGSVNLTIAAGSAQGPFDVEVVTGAGRTLVARGIVVDATSSASVTIAAPAGTRSVVQVVEPGTLVVVRELVLDSTVATSGAGG